MIDSEPVGKLRHVTCFILKYLQDMEDDIVLRNLYTVVWEETVFHSSVISNYYQLVKPHLSVFISEALLALTEHSSSITQLICTLNTQYIKLSVLIIKACQGWGVGFFFPK